jgi:hypothetical protein
VNTIGARSRVVVEAYATSRKIAGSSTDEVDFSNLPNPSSRIMPLGSTQSLIETSIWNIPARVKDGRRVGLTTLPPCGSRLSRHNLGASTSHNPMGLHGPLQDIFAFFFFTFTVNTILIVFPSFISWFG